MCFKIFLFLEHFIDVYNVILIILSPFLPRSHTNPQILCPSLKNNPGSSWCRPQIPGMGPSERGLPGRSLILREDQLSLLQKPSARTTASEPFPLSRWRHSCWVHDKKSCHVHKPVSLWSSSTLPLSLSAPLSQWSLSLAGEEVKYGGAVSFGAE